MPEQALPELPARLERLRSMPTAKAGDWYRIEAKAGTRKAEVSIFDEIGFFGTSAKDFAGEVRALDADEITLRLNSPGGNFFDGVAIYNALRDHPATVTTVVDGLAASAASVVAQAGDRIVMNRGSRMMIHNASGLVMGNARDMRDTAAVLEGIDASMADIYADRSGRPADEWRAAMQAETWYSAQEAVDAGLADAVAEEAKAVTAAARAPVTPAEAARHIHAASLKTPAAEPAVGPSTTTEGAAEMQFTDEDRAALRARYGLAADAGDDAIKAALLAPPSANPPTDPAPIPANADPAPRPTKPAVRADGTMVIDASAWEAQQEAIRQLQAADARRRREERDQVIAQAVADGKFAPARKDHWARLWDADPEGTREVIAGLQRNVIPTAELGYAGDGDDDSFEREFAGLFAPNRKGA